MLQPLYSFLANLNETESQAVTKQKEIQQKIELFKRVVEHKWR